MGKEAFRAKKDQVENGSVFPVDMQGFEKRPAHTRQYFPKLERIEWLANIGLETTPEELEEFRPSTETAKTKNTRRPSLVNWPYEVGAA